MAERQANSLRGRRAKAAGNNLESWLDMQHDKARYLGILAHIDKIDPPAVVRNGRVEFGERTVSDYVGMLDGGNARYFAAEAKSTLKSYLPRAEITTKQQAHLDVTTRSGGLALLVVEFRGTPSTDALVAAGCTMPTYRRYAVPWHSVPWTVKRTAESVDELDLVLFKWSIVNDCYLERFHPRNPAPTNPPTGRVYPRE